MISTYALVDSNGNITNTILWNGEDELTLEDGTEAVLCENASCVIGGKYKDGEFNPPEQPELSDEQHKMYAEQSKINYLSYAKDKISILQDAVDLEMATKEEISMLDKLKKYRVLLNRIDTSLAPNIKWPSLP